ncbi:MAG TPA: hypothetical protein VFM83_00480 [Gaiellaceae bacterium]|nr:hypothetical protein [Gaiellaceae bacterium]
MKRVAAALCVAMLAVGCGGGSDALRVSLDDVDPSGGFWAIRAMCNGGHIQVEFRPGERLSVPGLGHASSEEIAVECGKPERVAISDEELRRRGATPTGADLAEPTFEPTRLSCVADGSLVVEAHPVLTTQNAIVGGGFRVEHDGHAVVRGAILREEYEDPASQLQWWPALCRRA